jgi:hypothetical protein
MKSIRFFIVKQKNNEHTFRRAREREKKNEILLNQYVFGILNKMKITIKLKLFTSHNILSLEYV